MESVGLAVLIYKHFKAGGSMNRSRRPIKERKNLMSTQELISTNELQNVSVDNKKGQYTLWQILGIWLAAGAPMWLLSWVAYPVMSVGLAPFDAGLLRVELLTVGLIWEFLLAMIILYREEGDIRLSTIRRRFRLNHPVSAKTGETKKALWWWIIPLALLVAFLEIGFRSQLVQLWTAVFPFFAEPQGYDMSAMFAPELRAQMVGAWGLFGLFLAEAIFNTILGEEFIFRGVLLPRMGGVFGKWDWVANGVIFGFYHLHQPWGILSSVLTGLIYAFSAKRFGTTWYSIILHSGQSVFQTFLILGLVLGLA
jgi:membrane protease YdiL (CAAX protease family)